MTDRDTGTELNPEDERPGGLGRIGRGIRNRAGKAVGRYNGFLGSIGGKVSSRVAKGTGRLDAALGDTPWRMGGLDERGVRIARGVLTDVVPKAAGDRAASLADGVAIKAGAGGLGLALRIPLKPIIAPVLLVLGAVETVRAIRDIREGVGAVAERVDAELAARDETVEDRARIAAE